MARYISTPAVAVGFANRCVYSTPGTFTYTVPDGVTSIKAIAVGGGSPGSTGFLDNYSQVSQKACPGHRVAEYDNSDNTRLELNVVRCYGYGSCVYMELVDNVRREPFSLKKYAYGYTGTGGGFAAKTVAVTPGDTFAVTVGGQEGTSSFGSEISATGGSTPTIVRASAPCVPGWTRIDATGVATSTRPGLTRIDCTVCLTNTCCMGRTCFRACNKNKTCYIYESDVDCRVICTSSTPGAGTGGDCNYTGAAAKIVNAQTIGTTIFCYGTPIDQNNSSGLSATHRCGRSFIYMHNHNWQYHGMSCAGDPWGCMRDVYSTLDDTINNCIGGACAVKLQNSRYDGTGGPGTTRCVNCAASCLIFQGQHIYDTWGGYCHCCCLGGHYMPAFQTFSADKQFLEANTSGGSAGSPLGNGQPGGNGCSVFANETSTCSRSGDTMCSLLGNCREQYCNFFSCLYRWACCAECGVINHNYYTQCSEVAFFDRYQETFFPCLCTMDETDKCYAVGLNMHECNTIMSDWMRYMPIRDKAGAETGLDAGCYACYGGECGAYQFSTCAHWTKQNYCVANNRFLRRVGIGTRVCCCCCFAYVCFNGHIGTSYLCCQGANPCCNRYYGAREIFGSSCCGCCNCQSDKNWVTTNLAGPTAALQCPIYTYFGGCCLLKDNTTIEDVVCHFTIGAPWMRDQWVDYKAYYGADGAASDDEKAAFCTACGQLNGALYFQAYNAPVNCACQWSKNQYCSCSKSRDFCMILCHTNASCLKPDSMCQGTCGAPHFTAAAGGFRCNGQISKVVSAITPADSIIIPGSAGGPGAAGNNAVILGNDEIYIAGTGADPKGASQGQYIITGGGGAMNKATYDEIQTRYNGNLYTWYLNTCWKHICNKFANGGNDSCNCPMRSLSGMDDGSMSNECMETTTRQHIAGRCQGAEAGNSWCFNCSGEEQCEYGLRLYSAGYAYFKQYFNLHQRSDRHDQSGGGNCPSKDFFYEVIDVGSTGGIVISPKSKNFKGDPLCINTGGAATNSTYVVSQQQSQGLGCPDTYACQFNWMPFCQCGCMCPPAPYSTHKNQYLTHCVDANNKCRYQAKWMALCSQTWGLPIYRFQQYNCSNGPHGITGSGASGGYRDKILDTSTSGGASETFVNEKSLNLPLDDEFNLIAGDPIFGGSGMICVNGTTLKALPGLTQGGSKGACIVKGNENNPDTNSAYSGGIFPKGTPGYGGGGTICGAGGTGLVVVYWN